MKDYTYLIFDVDGTLLNFEKSERRAFDKTMETCGIPAGEELYRKYTRFCDALWEEYDLENTGSAYIQKNYHDLYRQYADRRFAGLEKELRTGKTPEEMNRIFSQRYIEESVPEPGAPEVCRYLSRNYKLVLATNGLEAIQKPRTSMFHEYISRIFTSEGVGAIKPSPDFFACICNTLGVTSPASCLMVGDSLTNDIAGAAAAGMKTCWYHPGKSAAGCGANPDYGITGLAELIHIL